MNRPVCIVLSTNMFTQTILLDAQCHKDTAAQRDIKRILGGSMVTTWLRIMGERCSRCLLLLKRRGCLGIKNKRRKDVSGHKVGEHLRSEL